MTIRFIAALLLTIAMPAAAREPIIDMHMHALTADDQGPPPLAMCTPIDPMPIWDPAKPYLDTFLDLFKHPRCADPIWSPTDDAAVMTRSIAMMEKYNIIGVVSGRYKLVSAWHKAAPDRVLFSLMPSDNQLGDLTGMIKDFGGAKAAGQLTAIGELGYQYAGIGVDDAKLDKVWAMAEALDVPVAIHMGPGPPGAAYLPGMGYQARLSSPLLLEPVLARHPKLRVNIMHAGFPMLDDTLALLYAHPQVHVDIGVIAYTQPRPAFYRYLQALVDAGFGPRTMFGSDQMVWPETIERAIQAVEQAPFLTPAQKRDIFYNNAARFLRLDAATQAKHKAM